MHVDIYTLENGEDTLLGTIRHDGQSLCAEPDIPRLRRLLDEPVYDSEAGEDVTVDDPERFLGLLQFQYRSPYFRVSAPEE